MRLPSGDMAKANSWPSWPLSIGTRSVCAKRKVCGSPVGASRCQMRMVLSSPAVTRRAPPASTTRRRIIAWCMGVSTRSIGSALGARRSCAMLGVSIAATMKPLTISVSPCQARRASCNRIIVPAPPTLAVQRTDFSFARSGMKLPFRSPCPRPCPKPGCASAHAARPV